MGYDYTDPTLPGSIPGLLRRGCTFPGCDRKPIARGLCGAHYKQQRDGKPLGPLRTEAPAARLDSLIEKSDGCWLWLGDHDARGYGRITHKGKARKAHRVVYEAVAGPIPDGLVLDHLCRNHGCVNPAHLEPVTNRTNVVERGHTVTAANAAKTHCRQGHEYTPENTATQRGGSKRVCRTCESARNRTRRDTNEYRAKHAAEERARRARVAE